MSKDGGVVGGAEEIKSSHERGFIFSHQSFPSLAISGRIEDKEGTRSQLGGSEQMSDSAFSFGKVHRRIHIDAASTLKSSA